MRIINIIEVMNCIPITIQSYPMFENQLSRVLIEEAESDFIDMINKYIYPKVLSEDEETTFIKGCQYVNKEYSITIMYSEI